MKSQAGQMRLNREARAAKKDIETSIKRDGRLKENFICLPDPENVYEWYYIAYDLDHKDFHGGYYMGKIKCPPDYPAKAPKVILTTTNGRFHTWDNGICLSISDYHQESWNPVWKVNQIVIGLVSFWVQEDEYTYGAVESYEADGLCKAAGMDNFRDYRIKLAKESRKAVMEHPKFEIFKPYAEAIGIYKEDEPESWADHTKRYAAREAEAQRKREEAALAEQKAREQEELEAQKRAEEEKQKALQEEKEARELQRKQDALEAAKLAAEEKAQRKKLEREEMLKNRPDQLLFLKLKELGLTKYVGQPAKLRAALAKA